MSHECSIYLIYPLMYENFIALLLLSFWELSSLVIMLFVVFGACMYGKNMFLVVC